MEKGTAHDYSKHFTLQATFTHSHSDPYSKHSGLFLLHTCMLMDGSGAEGWTCWDPQLEKRVSLICKYLHSNELKLEPNIVAPLV